MAELDMQEAAALGKHPPPGSRTFKSLYLDHRLHAIVESYSYRLPSTMPPPEVHHLFHRPIADHSFSADRQTLAVARDNNVELYGRSESRFALQDELKGHDKTVTSVDIAPTTGRIVTCSQGSSAEEISPAQLGANINGR